MPVKMKRYQFEVPENSAERIEEMKEELGVRTNGELFDNALTLLDWAIDHVRQGEVIASMDEAEQTHRVLTLPVLEYLRKSRRQQATMH